MPLPVDQRVYYAPSGSGDTGRIIELWNACPEGPYKVVWDNGDPPDWFPEQLLVPIP